MATPAPTSGLPSVQNILAGQAPIATTSAQADPPVYWGKATPPSTSYDWQYPKTPVDDFKTVSTAQDDFYNWDDSQRAAWGLKLYNAGLLKDPNDYNGMLQQWNFAVEQAAGYTAAGKKITPWKFADMLTDTKSVNKPTTQTSTNTHTYVPDPSVSKAAITTLFKEQLGRDPEPGELDRYTSMITAQYQKHPATTKTTQTTDSKGNSTSQSTESGQYDPTQYLQDQVKGDPEWGAYQAATTYFNALQGAIGAPG